MWLLQNKPERFWNDQTEKICIVNFVPTLSLSPLPPLSLTRQGRQRKESLGTRLMYHIKPRKKSYGSAWWSCDWFQPIIEQEEMSVSDKIVQKVRVIYLFLSGSTHCDQFFGRRRMNCHSIIKIFLCRSHFDRHRKSLEHLVAAYSKHVQTDNLKREKDSETVQQNDTIAPTILKVGKLLHGYKTS